MTCPECGGELELTAGLVMDTIVVACEKDCGWYLALMGSAEGRRVMEQLQMRLAELPQGFTG